MEKSRFVFQNPIIITTYHDTAGLFLAISSAREVYSEPCLKTSPLQHQALLLDSAPVSAPISVPTCHCSTSIDLARGAGPGSDNSSAVLASEELAVAPASNDGAFPTSGIIARRRHQTMHSVPLRSFLKLLC